MLAYLLPVLDLSCISTIVQGVPLKVERPRRKRRVTKGMKNAVVDKVRTEIEHKIYDEGLDSGLNQTYSDIIRVVLALLTQPTFRLLFQCSLEGHKYPFIKACLALFDSLGAQGQEVVKLLTEDQAYSKYSAEVR